MAIDVLMIGLRSVVGAQGGVESHVRHLAGELDKLGLRVSVVVRTPYAAAGQTLAGTRVKIFRLWAPRSSSAEAFVHSFLSVLYAGVTRPHVVHIHAIGPSIVAPIARLLGLKVITTHHGEDYRREKWGAFARLILRCGEICQARFSHGLICVSKTLAARLSEKYGRTFSYIPNGVVEPEKLPFSAVLEELGLKAGKYLVTVSRLVPEKRHLDLIEAFSKVNIQGLKLVIVGTADHKSEYARQVIRAAEQTEGVVLAGFRKGAELQDLFEHSAVFALPSSHEGLPIALLEAMSYGCKVVVSDIPPHLDLELSEDNYHKMANPSDLAAKLVKQIAGDDNVKQDWSSKLQQFRWDIIALKCLEKYGEASPRIKMHRYSSRSSADNVKNEL
ncbi:Glycosyltransferase involved in cell wall bisynthesis [Rhizobium sp. RU20A]|uniref:glycosyltransferase family 4 protein n=1 Tax=Rhizobium sp. RU20A TaxID=1907412 RepID=UPI0009544CE4|nr:glycosyltransferase family 4 protein [Rhizobium sp. RU20A]SIR11641.1 Glycosyltransferase involved in cell wall bisynthesis [Rhizobium sp. RU20A]